MIVRDIGLAALVLIWPCSAVGQTTFYAGGGALVCDSPKPLENYKTVYKDAEARGRYLTSAALANCQLVPKNSTYEAFNPKAAFVASAEVVRLHEKGLRKSLYALKGEWLVTSPELAGLARTIRSCIHSQWSKSKPALNLPSGMIVKVRLRLNPDGRFAEAPAVMNGSDCSVFQSVCDKAIKAAQACSNCPDRNTRCGRI
jgi:hypothetical protein